MRDFDQSIAASVWTGVFWLLAVLAIGTFAYVIAKMILDRRDAAALPAGDAAEQPAPGAIATGRQILDERLARGEIDVEEYQQRLTALDA